MERDWLWLIPAAPLATFAVNATLALAATRSGKRAPGGLTALLACGGPTIAFALSVMAWLQLRGLEPAQRVLEQTLYRWFAVGSFHVDIGFTIDPLASFMLLFVTGVGTLIHVYSIGYMRDDAGAARYFVYLNLFMFAMLLLVLGDSLPLLFVGWEGVGLCSYLLIGFWFEDSAKAAAGKKAFIVNRIGDFGVLIAMFLIVWTLSLMALRMSSSSDSGYSITTVPSSVRTKTVYMHPMRRTIATIVPKENRRPSGFATPLPPSTTM